MTGNTTTNERVRALFLAALMVVSVFAMTAAFAGTAAAAGNSSGFTDELPEGTVTDNTTNSTTTYGATSEIANVSFGTYGNVSNVTVNATGGDQGNVSASSIDGVTISLFNGTDEIVNKSMNYDSHNTTVKFGGTEAATDGNVTDVDNITIHADLSGSVVDGEVIDAYFTVQTNPSGWVDTVATQNVTTDVGYFSGRVSDGNNEDVEDALVIVENTSTGFEKTTRTNDQGDYTIAVPEGTYTVVADKEGFESASPRTGEVTAGQTTSANFVIEKIINADDIRVIKVESDDVAVADGEDEVSYTVEVTTNDTDEGDFVPLSGVDVDVTDTSDGVIDWYSTTETTDDNGTATFNASSTVVGEWDVTFTDDQDNWVNATATFRPEQGDAQLAGEVTNNETEVIDGTVWVAYQGENQTLAYAEENQPWLVSDTNPDGQYSIEGIVANTTRDEFVTDEWDTIVNVYVLADGYNAENETASADAWVAANETETVYDEETETHDFVLFPVDHTYEYQIDLTVEDQNGNFVESASIPAGETRDAHVHVERRPIQSTQSFQPAQVDDVTVELEDTAHGQLANETESGDVVTVDTDDNGNATLTFTATSEGQTGNATLNATKTNDEGDVYYDTAEFTLFGIGEISGDVVDENNDPVATSPEQTVWVNIYVQNNTTDAYEPAGDAGVAEANRVETAPFGSGQSGHYSIQQVRTDRDYKVNVTIEGAAENPPGFAIIQDKPAGTSTADIVLQEERSALLEASVDFTSQETDGTSVTVETATLPDGGFVAIHNDTGIIGVSTYLTAGSTDDLTITLDDQLEANQTLTAMVHQDNGDMSFNASEDPAYTDAGEPVTSIAQVTVTTESENSDLVRFDENNNGVIDQEEAFAAYQAYYNDEQIGDEDVSQTDAFAAYQAYYDGTAV